MFAEEISFYKLIKKIGSGGMGEVYLAEDTRLNRKVALKILPPEVAQDRKRLSRFLQEARLAANLNHPNICIIYEVNDSADTPFISMEYVEGETLSHKIQNRSLNLAETLDITMQIADALDEAHRQGIIHRDIKSANVIVNRRGQAKVLDFGLAKTVVENISDEAATQAKTEAGVLVGTVQYMSPEHALGKKLDGRTDLWSLGVLLYEMVTSETPFRGETQVGIFDEILHKKLQNPGEINENIPPELAQIILKLLEKDRDFRYQTASDLRADIRRLQRISDENINFGNYESRPSVENVAQPTVFVEASTESGKVQNTVASAVPKTEIAAWKFILIGVGILGLLSYGMFLLSGVIMSYLSSFNPQLSNKSFQVFESERLTNLGNISDAAVSEDGKYLVYVQEEGGLQSLWLRNIPTGSAVPIVPSANVIFQGIAISPDNSWVYYNIWDKKNVGEIFRVSSLGGAPQKVIHDCMANISISPDGKSIAFIRNVDEESAAYLISAEIGSWKETVFAKRAGNDGGFELIAWSPEGKSLAVLGGKTTDDGKYLATLSEVETETKNEKTIWRIPQNITRFGGGIVWAKDKSGLFLTLGESEAAYQQIWFIDYSSGEARQFTKNFNNYGRLSLTADGKKLVSVQQDFTSNVWVFPVDKSSPPDKITNGKLEGIGLYWSPDGRIIYGSAVSGSMDIWIIDADGKNRRQLTSDPGAEIEPCVSADGRRIFFLSNQNQGNWNVWSMDLDGSNKKQFLLEGTQGAMECSRGDNSLIFLGSYKETYGLWKMPLDGSEPIPLPNTTRFRPAISPDGQKMAYTYWDEIKKQMSQQIVKPLLSKSTDVLPPPPLEKFSLPLTAVGEYGQSEPSMRWTADSKNLSFINEEKSVENIWLRPLGGGPLKKITNFTEGSIYRYDWSNDGKKIALTRYSITSDAVVISNTN